MELDENYHHARKRPCLSNGHPPSKIDHKELHAQDEVKENGEKKKDGGGANKNNISNCLMPWQNHPSSRIYRVSRASGGKDRHSKVYTTKGLRDRRVRLSVSTAIQFYDLQDRLGYDQPSKAIEWLIKAAATAIDELPLLDNFLRLPSQHPTNEDKPVETIREEPNYNHHQQQHLSTKSGSSSNSETSKGSVLSLSRSENRVKKRERARERAAKDKEKKRDQGGGPAVASHHQRNLSSNLNTHTSFTELLTASGGGDSNGAIAAAATGVESNLNCIPKQTSTADYFCQAGLFNQSQKNPQLSSGFSPPSHFGHNAVLSMMPFNIAAATVAAPGNHQEMHQFSLQDHLIPVSAVAATGEYNLNFSMSSGFMGFNRGTLQSNSPSQLPHHNHHHHNNQVHLQQRLSTPIDGSSLPFFFGSAAAVANTAENTFPPGFDGRLQLCYNDGFHHTDLKEKRKS